MDIANGRLPCTCRYLHYFRDVAKMKFQTAESARTYATFLPRLADKAPRLVNKQMSLLIQHLDNEVRRTAAECTVAA